MKALQLAIAAMFLTAAPLAGCGTTLTANVADVGVGNATGGMGVFSVTVTDNNARPVPGAAVVLRNAQGQTLGGTVTSDANGVVTFKGVATGDGYSVVAAKGSVGGAQTGLGVDSESPVLVSVMLVSPNTAKGTVAGAVIDAVSGRPLDGATVSVMGTQSKTKTQADGSFTVQAPVGSPQVVVSMPGYKPQQIQLPLTSGALQRKNLQLVPAGDASRIGHTVITMANEILEVDRNKLKVADHGHGGNQARALINGDTLIAAPSAVVELDANNNTVWSYRPLMFGALANPQGCCKASNGNVYIADSKNNRVLVVSQNGSVQSKLSFNFSNPLSVEREEDTHTTLVADTGNNRVVEVNDSGVETWGLAMQLLHPAYAQRLPNDDIVIADTGNSRILQIDRAQGARHVWGGDGNGATCRFPMSAQGLPNGDLLIADTGNNRVIEVKYTGDNTPGTIVWEIDNLPSPPLFAERI